MTEKSISPAACPHDPGHDGAQLRQKREYGRLFAMDQRKVALRSRTTGSQV